MSELISVEDVLRALADGKNVQMRYRIATAGWITTRLSTLPIHSILSDSAWEFRIKPDVERIGDVDVPTPENNALALREIYYTASTTAPKLYKRYSWVNSKRDYHLLHRAMVHKTKEAAIAHAKALVFVSGGGGEIEG